MRGFTLIETVIYIALLGMLMTGTVMTTYNLLESVQKSDGKATKEDEGTFVLRKLAWALADMSAAPTIGGSGCNQTLTVTKTNYPHNPVVFQRNSTNNTIEIRQAGVSATALTTSNVSATCLSFEAIAAAGRAPAGIVATHTLNGTTFTITRYVHK